MVAQRRRGKEAAMVEGVGTELQTRPGRAMGLAAPVVARVGIDWDEGEAPVGVVGLRCCQVVAQWVSVNLGAEVVEADARTQVPVYVELVAERGLDQPIVVAGLTEAQ